MAGVTPEPIMKIAMGFMAAKHLFVASEVGLFEALAAGPADLATLGRKTGVPARTLGILAAALTSVGLLEQDGSNYKNSEAAAAFLAGVAGPDLRPNLRFWDQISYPMWQQLADAVRSGERQAQFGRFDSRQQEIFSMGVEAFTAPVAAVLAQTYDFGRHRRILDVAGGTGSFLVAVLKNHPALQATLFELPGPCAVARLKLENLPEGKRISIVEGDVFKDPLPDGHDVVIVANAAHVFSADHNVAVMKSIRGSVAAGARLLLADLWTDPTYTQPTPAALMSGEFLVFSGEGQSYSAADAGRWLDQSGWRMIERKPLAGPASLIVAEAV
jgi:ubiquinone/menaquinone biosynthesis C-methylase UbiE